jgi:hypothetical protein
MTARGREARIADAASVPALLGELRAVAAESAAIEPGDGEPAVADAVRALVGRARAVLNELQALDGDEAAAAGDDDWLGVRAGAPSPVGDLCFAGALELARVHRELATARGGDEVLAAVEAARRELRRAIHAVLDAAGEAVAAPGPDPGPSAEVEASLAVRRLYTDLRRSLRRPDGESPEAVLTALRYAAFALATLVAAPAYAAVRAPDRFVVRTLHRRCIDWARRDRSPGEGLRILEDVWISADLLRAINRRQELRVHDAAAVRSSLAGPRGDTRDWFVQLERLFGLDDVLDELIVRARQGGNLDGLIPEALVRLAQIT